MHKTVSSQLHALVALPPWMAPPVLIDQEVGCAPEPALTLWSTDKSLTTNSRTLVFQYVARCYTD
jgi:hypothetical protein